MIRKSIFSALAGVVFATILTLSTTASASCFGFCAERIGKYYYVGCDLVLTGVDIYVTCYYIEGPDPGGDPTITD